ncbi:MAG: MFS transporter [Thermodesulfobacteriota bacterium]|jgi:EmrB/QacA subfamily drug resistance transporter
MNPPINKRTALVATTAASFLTPFAGTSVNIALPSIGRDFAMDAILLSWVPTAYLLAAAMFLVPFGRIGDIYGRKKVFVYGMVIFTLGALLSGVAQSALALILFRAVQGIGASMIFGTGVAIVTSIFAEGERGKALGINVASVYVGQSVGPFIGGFLTEHLGWRSIFLVMVPLGVFLLVAILKALKQEWAGARGESFDWVGSIIYSLTLVAIMYGFSLLPRITGGVIIALGGCGLLAFILWELREKSPILNINLFRGNRVFAFSNLAALVNYSATFAVSFLLSLFLQYIKGYTPLHAGSILVFQPATQAIFSPFAGRLSDRMEPRIVASIGMSFTAIGLLLLVFLKEETSLAYIVACLLLLGFGFALFSSPNTNAIMSSVDRKSYGVASGTTSTMRVIGQMLSMGVATLIFAVYIGRVQINVASHQLFLKSIGVAFAVFAVLCFGGIFASLARGKLR